MLSGEEENDIIGQLQLLIEVHPMTPTTEKIQSAPHNKNLAYRWILMLFLLLLVLVVWGSTPAYSSSVPNHENLQVNPSHTPLATSTPTRTSQPTATITPTSLSTSVATSPTIITVSAVRVYLRTGPSLNYSGNRRLTQGEQLLLLGRSSDDNWLYVKTSDGQDGWIEMRWLDLTGKNLDPDDFPVTTPSPPPPATINVSDGRVNLRTGPGNHYSFIRKLTYGDQLQLLGRLSDNTWLYVKTTNSEEGWVHTSAVDLTRINLNHVDYPTAVAPPTETATRVVLSGVEGRWIDIDLSEQTLRAYEGTELVGTFLVSTGINKYPTETGQYHIYVKYTSSLMHGPDYYLPDVPYSMYYSGDFSIHGTYWHHNFGTPMSHGCVNMDISEAEWLFNWSSIGTLVNIHR